MKTILVTGGAGFIGSSVNKLLHRFGYKTIVLDNLSRGCQARVRHGIFVHGDIGDRDTLEKLFSQYKIDAVMHFAAFIDVGESIHSPSLYYQNNVVNSLILLEMMRRFSIDKFIFSSTAAVYGLPEKNLVDEEHPLQPINPYGETKLILEKKLGDFDQEYGLKSCTLRYFNAAGADPEGEIRNIKPRHSNLIPILLNCLIKEEPITIFGTDYETPDGTCIRDFIHIDDLGMAHIKAMIRLFEGKESTTYNLGNGKGHSVREVIQAVEKVTNKKIKVVEGSRRPGDPPYLIASSAKANRELNWIPRYTLEEMIAHAWNIPASS